MRKIWNSDWGQGIFQSILYGMEILFVFGIAVDLSAFYMGISSAWVSLFAYMVSLGALLFAFLLSFLTEQRMNEAVCKHAIFIKIIIYACTAFSMDYRIALIMLAIDLVLYLLLNRIQIQNISVFAILIVASFAYMHAWISLAECIVLTLSQTGIFIKLSDRDSSYEKKKGYDFKMLWKVEKSLYPWMSLLIILKTILYGCIVVSFGIFEVAIVHIANEGEFFNASHIFPYWIILCAVQCLVLYFAKKVQNRTMEKDPAEDTELKIFHTSVIPERIALHIVMIIAGIVLARASVVLCGYFILTSVSLAALQIMTDATGQMNWKFSRNVRSLMIRLFLVGDMVIVKQLYDGVFVDYSVVLISVLLFYGIVLCTQTWKKDDVLLETLLDFEEEE